MSASGGSLRVAMELIIILAVVAVLTLVVVGGLFVGRSKGGTATLPPETKAPTPSSTPTEDAIDPAKTPAIETPEPDEEIDPY